MSHSYTENIRGSGASGMCLRMRQVMRFSSQCYWPQAASVLHFQSVERREERKRETELG